jgi:hypothetical protein
METSWGSLSPTRNWERFTKSNDRWVESFSGSVNATSLPLAVTFYTPEKGAAIELDATLLFLAHLE